MRPQDRASGGGGGIEDGGVEVFDDGFEVGSEELRGFFRGVEVDEGWLEEFAEFDVAVGEAAGLEHGVIPRGAAALSVTFLGGFGLGLGGICERLGGFAFLDALLRFEDVATALVKIYSACARGTVRVVKRDVALEYVGI